jgi:hypothetical protein
MATPEDSGRNASGQSSDAILFSSSDAHAGALRSGRIEASPGLLGVVLALIPTNPRGKARHLLLSRRSAARLSHAVSLAAIQSGGPSDA